MRSHPNAEALKKDLQLEGHIEGGFFARTHESKQIILLDEADQARYKDTSRNAGTSIYFMLENSGFSAWHRLRSDETWLWHGGTTPIHIHVIDQKGNLETLILGDPLTMKGAKPQRTVEKEQWFSAELRDKELSYALVGCTVSPGFQYKDFELAKRGELETAYPKLSAEFINKFIQAPEKKKDEAAAASATHGVGTFDHAHEASAAAAEAARATTGAEAGAPKVEFHR